MKIAVIFGGISTERNVAITGGRSVIEALRGLGYDVMPCDPAFGAEFFEQSENLFSDMSQFNDIEEIQNYDPRNYINAINSSHFDEIDAAFIVLHGKYGEDGLIQSLLEFRGIPYTGSKVKASSLSSDKSASKYAFASSGVLTPPWILVSREDVKNENLSREIRNQFGKELVIKPNDQGSTIGLTIVETGNLDDIERGLELASKYSNDILIEKYIAGRELTVGIVGDDALPIIEIDIEDGFYDYEHKYTKGKTNYICPAEISEDIAEFTQSMALAAYHSLGCSGFGRVDFRLDDEGQPFCLEVNTIPGFTAQSLVPMAAKLVGTEFPELCKKLIDIAIEDFNKRK
ncbi:MAG: D-alanine--D-alanine ligase [Candidatus Kapabacteria bacterium]|nr:D-alanine--D-alanine ligase [Ignavibacteriota bacterium]MCW5884557.1 D-alanine--D-alanine ligase [Candidatus Kapabacteria bacterium]